MTRFRHALSACLVLSLAANPVPAATQSQGVVPQTRPCNPHTSSDCFPILVINGPGGKKAEIPIDRDEALWRQVLAGNSTIDPKRMDRSAARIFKAASGGGAMMGSNTA